MEPLYTAETRSQIERVLSVFRDYIVTTNYFDILYSKKVGYIYVDINPKRMTVLLQNRLPDAFQAILQSRHRAAQRKCLNETD